METRFGRQPAHLIARQHAQTMRSMAEDMGVSERHLHDTVTGKVRPQPAVREMLPKILGLPLDELFTARILEREYDPTRNPWRVLA